jgi:hypothetical protein
MNSHDSEFEKLYVPISVGHPFQHLDLVVPSMRPDEIGCSYQFKMPLETFSRQTFFGVSTGGSKNLFNFLANYYLLLYIQ